MKIKLPVSHFPRQYDSEVLEMMDRPGLDGSLLEEDLRNIQRINRWLGARRLIHAELERLFPHGRSEPYSFLDFCTGSADIPRCVVDWCRPRGIPVRVTATDRNPLMLAQARRESAAYPEITFQAADILLPPFDEASFDGVMCNLALHHFSVEHAVAALRNMWRITRSAMLVNDLNRRPMLSLLAKIMIPMLSANPMTRFDAYLSTRRAFTTEEMLRLAFHAEIPSPEIRRYFFSRQVLFARKAISPKL